MFMFVCSPLTVSKMELINECSMRFAEDKDFRLLVSPIL